MVFHDFYRSSSHFSGIMILVSGKHNTFKIRKKQPTWLRIVYLGTLLIMGAYTGYFGAAGGVIVLVIFNLHYQ